MFNYMHTYVHMYICKYVQGVRKILPFICIGFYGVLCSVQQRIERESRSLRQSSENVLDLRMRAIFLEHPEGRKVSNFVSCLSKPATDLVDNFGECKFPMSPAVRPSVG